MTNQLIHELEHVLRKNLDGEVYTTAAYRKLYSTDASIYQIEPLGVVFPRTEDDLSAAVELTSSFQVPILPRGSGSSLAGQTVGASLVIDCSRYLTKVREFDPEARTAVVQPGVVLDALNRYAAPNQLKFGPDPASSDRATFGGMIGNNSTGAHSIQFGMTADHILSLEAILSDGSQASLDEVSEKQAQENSRRDTRLGSIFQAAMDIRRRQQGEIMERWPVTWRRASGYSLNYLLPWAAQAPPRWGEENYPPIPPGKINLAKLVVGSEGTLAVIKSAKIRLVPSPQHTILSVLSYGSIEDACDAAAALLETDPSAVELVPRALIERARTVPAYAELLWFVQGDPAALLVVEYAGDDPKKLESQAKDLDPRAIIAATQQQQESIWKVRKVGLGLLMSRPGDSKPLPFIEDAAVPVEHLGEFVREFRRIVESFGVSGDFYAHASAGCLHVRPIINIKSEAGIAALRGITAAVVELVVRLGGALSGEHGDGLARSEWLQAVYGRKIVSAFAQLKQAADPDSILNPGKIVSPPPMHENLRYGTNYRSRGWEPVLDFSDQAGLVGAVEMCNGAGVCRKSDGVMCPSFQVSNEEMHSTRGRANLLRAMISGPKGLLKQNERDAFEALELCVECKGCKAECPSAVDMAKLKTEFLHHYYKHHRRPLRDYLFAYLPDLARAGAMFGPFAAYLMGRYPFRRVFGPLLKLTPHRKWPAVQRSLLHSSSKEDTGDGAEHVILMLDVFSQYIEPQLAAKTIQVLEAAGCYVHLLDAGGAGRPLISKGFLGKAKRHAAKLISAIEDIDPRGSMPVVGIEPSEIFTLRDEYLAFFPEDQAARSLAARAYLVDEFLVRPGESGVPRIDRVERKESTNTSISHVYLHGHCHQKTQPPSPDGHPSGVGATTRMLEAAGHQVEEIETGCCGMAGSFGYEAEHHEFSLQIGEYRLFPTVRGLDSGDVVAAPGASCRSQIETGTGRHALHPIELLADSLSLT